jgi:hypothetical protein
MRIVDYEPQWWFLYEENGALFLDGNYNHSFVGYDFMIQLNLEEVAQYRERGREFINWLAEDVQNSVPILKISESRYKERRVPEELSKRALAAHASWKPNSR